MPFQHFGDGGSQHLLSWIFVLLVILLVGVIVYFAVRYASKPIPGVPAGGFVPPPHDLLAVVAHRYANGEISRDEFLHISADLGGPPVPAAESPPLE